MKPILLFGLFFTIATSTLAQQDPSINDHYDPRLFGISSRFSEWTTTFSPDGKTVYYSLGSSPYVILYSKYEQDKWGQPAIASFSGQWFDTDPFITYDGQWVYFSSNRPFDQNPESKANANFYIWRAKKTGDNKWSPAMRLDTVINYPGVNSWYPSESEDGTFYFHSFTRPGGHGKNDIYVSRRTGDQFSKPELLPFDTAGSNTQEARISKKNDFMLFVSDRPGRTGLSDIYIVFHKEGKWSNPINLGLSINCARVTNMAPALSNDEHSIYFTNNHVPFSTAGRKINTYKELLDKMSSCYNGSWNIWQAPFNSNDYLKEAIF